MYLIPGMNRLGLAKGQLQREHKPPKICAGFNFTP